MNVDGSYQPPRSDLMLLQEPFADNWVTTLGEYGHIPNGVIHVQTHESAEQQVVVELFHQ